MAHGESPMRGEGFSEDPVEDRARSHAHERVDDPLHLSAPIHRTIRLNHAEEAILLDAARQGDMAALRTLLDSVSGPILRFGQGFCHHPEDAEDVMQDVLSSLVRTLRSFRGDASLTTWAYTACGNVRAAPAPATRCAACWAPVGHRATARSPRQWWPRIATRPTRRCEWWSLQSSIGRVIRGVCR